MALRFIDAIGVIAGSSEYRRWNVTANLTYHASGGRRNAAYYTLFSGEMLKTLTHGTRFIIGAAWAWQNNNNGPLLGVYNDNTPIAIIYVNNDYTVQLNVDGTRAGAISSVAVAAPSEWHYYELDVTVSASGSVVVGTGTIRVDGNTIVTGTCTSGRNVNTLIDGSATINQVGPQVTGTGSFMDFYSCDGATTDINGHTSTCTAFLGDVEIDALMPVTDVTTNMSTFGGDGTHAYSCVNEIPADDDTSYVFTSNTGSSEAFNHQSITGFTGTIVGAQYAVLARKDSEGLRTFTAQVGTSTVTSVEFLAAPQYLAEAYFYYNFPLDSDNGTAWTTAVYNAEKFGVTLNS